MEKLHRIAKEDLRLKLLGPIPRQQVVKIQGQRGVGDPSTLRVAGRHSNIAPTGIVGDLKQEQVYPVFFLVLCPKGAIWRERGDGDRASQCRSQRTVDHRVVDEVL